MSDGGRGTGDVPEGLRQPLSAIHGPLRSFVDQVVDQQRYRAASARFLRARLIRGARDVQVCPLQAVRELRQETGRRDGAAFTSGDIGEVGEVALQAFRVFFADRQLPGAILSTLASLDEFGAE